MALGRQSHAFLGGSHQVQNFAKLGENRLTDAEDPSGRYFLGMAKTMGSRRLGSLIAGGFLATLLGMAKPAEATVVKDLTLLEKSEVAKVVVHGVVERVEVEWEVPEAKLQTLVTLRILESIKGGFEQGQLITFRRGGGTLGDFTQTAPGLSKYEVGEEVLMFLEPLGASYVGIGIGIGKYEVRVAYHQESFVPVVFHDPHVAGLRYQSGRPVGIKQIEPMTPEPLAVFKKRLRSYVRGITNKVRIPANTVELKEPYRVITGR